MNTSPESMNNTMQKSVDYRAFLKVLESIPEATVAEVTNEGDVVFDVPLQDLGLTLEAVSGNPITDSYFFANFVGEYVVRRNIAQFAEILFNIDPKVYEETVCAVGHNDFGMEPSRTHLRFRMHISLVLRILTEDCYKALQQ